MHWNIILSLHLETMPWPQVCQRKERSCQDVIIPPHPSPPHPTPRIWRRCHVECGCASVSEEGKQLPGRDYPTPPHPPASGDDAMLSVAASVSEEGTQLPGRYYPTPPHPPASGDDAMLSVAASVSEEGTQLPGRYYPTPHRIWGRFHVECGHKCVRGRNAAARTLLSHPTPPTPSIWRRCYVDCGRNCDADVGF